MCVCVCVYIYIYIHTPLWEKGENIKQLAVSTTVWEEV